MLKYFFVILFPFASYGATLSPFSTDECTYFPEGTQSSPKIWAHCCVEHDLKYWIGGTKAEQVTSDLKLKECVTKSSSEFYGELMYRGVIIGNIKIKYP